MTKTGVYWLSWSSVFRLVDDMNRHNFFLDFLAGEAIFTISISFCDSFLFIGRFWFEFLLDKIMAKLGLRL